MPVMLPRLARRPASRFVFDPALVYMALEFSTSLRALLLASSFASMRRSASPWPMFVT